MYTIQCIHYSIYYKQYSIESILVCDYVFLPGFLPWVPTLSSTRNCSIAIARPVNEPLQDGHCLLDKMKLLAGGPQLL